MSPNCKHDLFQVLGPILGQKMGIELHPCSPHLATCSLSLRLASLSLSAAAAASFFLLSSAFCLCNCCSLSLSFSLASLSFLLRGGVIQ